MSYNGSGTFNINSTGQPVVAGTVITASAFNALTTDLATGLTTAITKDGQTTTTARITFAQGINSSLVTDSSSTSTGSIITAGGVGIAKALYVGTTANVAGAVTLGGIATFSAQPIFSSLTASSAVATDASKGLVSVTNTGTGNNVLATSPTITTPTISSLSSASATNLVLQAAGTTAITVNNSTGNVSINAGASPTAKLAVTTGTGSSLLTAFSDGVAQTLQIGTSSTGLYFNNSNSGYQAFQIGSTEAMRIASDSSILVNTSTNSASTKVAILGSSTVNGISVRDGTVAGNYESSDATRTSYWQFGRDNVSTGNFVFTYNGSQKMAIDTSGNLLVGMTSFAQSSSTKGFGVRGSDGLVSMSRSTDSLALDMYHTSDGQIVRFNNTSSTAVGNINAGSSLTTYNTTSDYRLKENVVPMTGALATVAQLKPVTYKWKSTGENGQGFIAHELQEVVPDCVTGTKDATQEQEYEVTPAVKDEEGNITTPAVMGTRTVPDYQSIDTSFLVATLTAAIQELKAINDTQAETLTQQTEAINALTARITALENA